MKYMQFCQNNERIDNNMRLYAFNKILISLLNSKIKFNRSKEQPLIPKQSLNQSNKFRTVLFQFIKHFGINIDVNVSNVGKDEDKKTANAILSLVMNSLYEIEKFLLSSHFTQYSLFKEKVFTSKLIDYTIFETKAKRKRNNVQIGIRPEIRQRRDYCTKHKTKVYDCDGLYSVMVPCAANMMIKYKFISFNPLIVTKKFIHK